MDFDIGTLIYIVLGIIYFIFTSANRNKKKGKPKRPKPAQSDAETLGPPPIQRPTFEELLEEFTTGKRPAPDPEVINVPPASVAEERPLGPASKPLPVFKKHKRLETEFAPFEEFEQEEVERSPYAEIFSDIDGAKKAFIASEIFKRRY